MVVVVRAGRGGSIGMSDLSGGIGLPIGALAFVESPASRGEE